MRKISFIAGAACAAGLGLLLAGAVASDAAVGNSVALTDAAGDDVSEFFLTNHGFDTRFNYDASLTGNIKGDVINEVYGWINETTATYTVAGTFAYNPNLTFNSSNPLPAEGFNGSKGGALGLTTGWGMELVYSQNVTLPKGKYHLQSVYYNAGTGKVGKSLLAWMPESGANVLSKVNSFEAGQWTEDDLSFTLTKETTGKIRIGFAANEGVGSGNQAKLLVDYVKIVCDELDRDVLKKAIDEAQAAYGDGSGSAADELKKAIDAARKVYDDDSSSVTMILSATRSLEEATRNYLYGNASDKNPLDVTSLIVNNSFENGFSGWNNSGMATQTNSYFTMKAGNTYIEKWVSKGSRIPDAGVSQTISDLQNGRYRLTAAALNIQQKGSNSTANDGDPQTGVVIYAGMSETPVSDMKDYSVDFSVVDGTVEIGVRSENSTGNWMTADNFRLSYLGANSTADHIDYLKTYISDIRGGLLSQHLQDSARKDAESVISGVEALFAGNVDEAAVLKAKGQLDEVVVSLQKSAALYATLLKEIDYARKVVGWYKDDTARVTPLETAITTAESAWNNFTLTDGQLEDATDAIKAATQKVDKRFYTAQWSMGNVNDPSNVYYVGRTRQSKNWILFWEKGYGEDPKTFTCGNYTIDVDEVLRRADIAFDYYTDVLKYTKRGSSKTDTYKMVIRLRYEPNEWEASGSGVDNIIGLLTLTPWAAPSRNWQTLYHEIGHCFQYQVHCDNGDQNGWMYAPGNGNGCAFWEQCAQWQAYKIMPEEQFTNEWFNGYLSNVHKHILHESPRYNNFFVQDYWTYRHGIEFMGRLWNESRNPEDAVEAYMRITGINTSQFYDEMYDCAARFASWDIPALSKLGAGKVTTRPLPAMTKEADDFWRIDPAVAPENTGHNIIRLNLPKNGGGVTAIFEGLNNEAGFRVKNPTAAEWRFGFVAQLNDGSRVYGTMNKATYDDTRKVIYFDCPEDCKRLWFVVSGGSKNYWRQVWDDNDANDEQWPYKVKFGNTNRYGSTTLPDTSGIICVEDDTEIPAVIVERDLLRVGECGARVTIQVMTTSGIMVRNIEGGISPVDIELASGIYMVRILSEDGRTLLTTKVAMK